MAYTSPTITASSQTFANLQARGLTGHVEGLIAANTFSAEVQRLMRLGQQADLQRLYEGLSSDLSNWLSGRPIATSAINATVLNYTTALKALLAAAEEIAVLVDANAGTLGTALDGKGEVIPVRTFS